MRLTGVWGTINALVFFKLWVGLGDRWSGEGGLWCGGDGWGCVRGDNTNDKRDGILDAVWVLTGLRVKMYYTRMKCGTDG